MAEDSKAEHPSQAKARSEERDSIIESGGAIDRSKLVRTGPDGQLHVSTIGAHAPTHVTGGGDTIADAVPAGNSGLLSGAELTNLQANTLARHAQTHAIAGADHTANDWNIFGSNGFAQVVEIANVAAGSVLTSAGVAALPVWAAPVSSGHYDYIQNPGPTALADLATWVNTNGPNKTVLIKNGTYNDADAVLNAASITGCTITGEGPGVNIQKIIYIGESNATDISNVWIDNLRLSYVNAGQFGQIYIQNPIRDAANQGNITFSRIYCDDAIDATGSGRTGTAQAVFYIILSAGTQIVQNIRFLDCKIGAYYKISRVYDLSGAILSTDFVFLAVRDNINNLEIKNCILYGRVYNQTEDIYRFEIEDTYIGFYHPNNTSPFFKNQNMRYNGIIRNVTIKAAARVTNVSQPIFDIRCNTGYDAVIEVDNIDYEGDDFMHLLAKSCLLYVDDAAEVMIDRVLARIREHVTQQGGTYFGFIHIRNTTENTYISNIVFSSLKDGLTYYAKCLIYFWSTITTAKLFVSGVLAELGDFCKSQTVTTLEALIYANTRNAHLKNIVIRAKNCKDSVAVSGLIGLLPYDESSIIEVKDCYLHFEDTYASNVTNSIWIDLPVPITRTLDKEMKGIWITNCDLIIEDRVTARSRTIYVKDYEDDGDCPSFVHEFNNRHTIRGTNPLGFMKPLGADTEFSEASNAGACDFAIDGGKLTLRVGKDVGPGYNVIGAGAPFCLRVCDDAAAATNMISKKIDAGHFTNTTNPEKITIPSSGWYEANVVVNFGDEATDGISGLIELTIEVKTPSTDALYIANEDLAYENMIAFGDVMTSVAAGPLPIYAHTDKDNKLECTMPAKYFAAGTILRIVLAATGIGVGTDIQEAFVSVTNTAARI